MILLLILQPRAEVVGKVPPLFRKCIFPSEANKVPPNITFPNKDADPHPSFQCWILNAQFMPDETQHCIEGRGGRAGKGEMSKASQHFCHTVVVLNKEQSEIEAEI